VGLELDNLRYRVTMFFFFLLQSVVLKGDDTAFIIR
jgi:hypothetical protein